MIHRARGPPPPAAGHRRRPDRPPPGAADLRGAPHRRPGPGPRRLCAPEPGERRGGPAPPGRCHSCGAADRPTPRWPARTPAAPPHPPALRSARRPGHRPAAAGWWVPAGPSIPILFSIPLARSGVRPPAASDRAAECCRCAACAEASVSGLGLRSPLRPSNRGEPIKLMCCDQRWR